jgi:hypothetical protein
MSPTRRPPPILAATVIALALLLRSHAAEAPAPAFAADLASRLSALYQNGSTYVRARMEIKGATKETLQLQIKQRRTKSSTDILYQVLFPKDRKGESVLLRKTGDRPASGLIFTPPATVRPVESMKSPLLGSDLTCEDIVENFFAWDGVNCTILESKPGKGERSSYGSVRTWVDTRRTVPLRVEKYSSSGQLLRRIDTTRVVPDAGNHIPANLVVHGALPNLTTELEGSRIRHDVTFTDADFSEEGLKQMSAPRGSGE